MRKRVTTVGYAYMMSLAEYCQAVGGVINRFGDIVSEKDGKVICSDRIANVFGIAQATYGDRSRYLCFVCQLSGGWLATVNLVDEENPGAVGGITYDVPLNALYHEVDLP